MLLSESEVVAVTQGEALVDAVAHCDTERVPLGVVHRVALGVCDPVPTILPLGDCVGDCVGDVDSHTDGEAVKEGDPEEGRERLDDPEALTLRDVRAETVGSR